MKALGTFLLLVTAVGLTGNANAEPTQYLCTVEQSAGLHFDRQIGKWRPQEFAGRKYILRRLTDEDHNKQRAKWWATLDAYPEANWAFFEYGKVDPIPLSACKEPGKEDFLSYFACHEILLAARFDKDTRRFEMTVSPGYIQQGFWEKLRREEPDYFARLLANGRALDPSNPDDGFVEIGTCSPL
jgi:hypothetical protein